MDARELRIGNYVNISRIGVYQVNADDIYLADRSNCTYVSPITLTEEILGRLGFRFETKSHWSLGIETKYNVYSNEPIVYNSIRGHFWIYGILTVTQPKYVHQLQNLYFALTGQELTLANEGRRDV